MEQCLQHCFSAYGIGHVTISPEIHRGDQSLSQSSGEGGGCQLPTWDDFGCSVTDLRKRRGGAWTRYHESMMVIIRASQVLWRMVYLRPYTTIILKIDIYLIDCYLAEISTAFLKAPKSAVSWSFSLAPVDKRYLNSVLKYCVASGDVCLLCSCQMIQQVNFSMWL